LASRHRRYYVTSIGQHDYGVLMAMTILYAFVVAFLISRSMSPMRSSIAIRTARSANDGHRNPSRGRRPTPKAAASRGATRFARLRKNKLSMIGLVMVIFLLFVAIVGPFITPYNYQIRI